MSVNNPELGSIDCFLCGRDAKVRESRKGKSYIVCDGCGLQLFSRGVESDQAIRKRMKPIEAAPVEQKQPEAKAPVKAKVTRHTADGETSQSVKVIEPQEETTIFDGLGSLFKKAVEK